MVVGGVSSAVTSSNHEVRETDIIYNIYIYMFFVPES